MIVRAILGSAVVVIALLFPWWCTLVAITIYTRYYVGIEVLMAMILIDAMFGTLYSSPLLTLSAVIVVALMAWLRPRLRSAPPYV